VPAVADRVVFDFPTAGEIMGSTKPAEHHERCSYRQTNQALLCDCAALAATDVAWQLAHRRAGDPDG
jgi:hypothetical protein